LISTYQNKKKLKLKKNSFNLFPEIQIYPFTGKKRIKKKEQETVTLVLVNRAGIMERA
jgi:hypothetical protein